MLKRSRFCLIILIIIPIIKISILNILFLYHNSNPIQNNWTFLTIPTSLSLCLIKSIGKAKVLNFSSGVTVKDPVDGDCGHFQPHPHSP